MSSLKEDRITIKRFTFQNSEMLEKLVACYQAVFGGAPWGEWKKCSVCGAKWGIEDLLPESHCNAPLDEFWPTAVVTSDIRNEVTEDASCWVATKDNSVIGFCWGYPISVDQLEIKLKLPGFARELRERVGNIQSVAYQDELGVRVEYRGRGIAKAMYSARHADFLSRGLSVGVVRTKRTPPSVTYSWFLKIGYNLVSEYRDADDRIVLARNIGSLVL